MMENDIKNFAKQFAWEPKVENRGKLKKYRRFVVTGMGGSHLAADLLARLYPTLDVRVHADYGLPRFAQDSFVIASSYSGNTEETIDACKVALRKKIPVGVIATGGKLLAFAKRAGIPYIQMPSGMTPRAATGLSFMALLKMMGEDRLLREARKSARNLKPTSIESSGRNLAKKLYGRVPVVYASAKNVGLAYRWKIAFNETGKVPAFYNVLPEQNHNEISGFDVRGSTKALSKQFLFIFLKDSEDHPRVVKRMKLLEKLYQARGLPATVIALHGTTTFAKIFSSVVLADWAALHLAAHYHLDPDATPIINELKNRMAKA